MSWARRLRLERTVRGVFAQRLHTAASLPVGPGVLCVLGGGHAPDGEYLKFHAPRGMEPVPGVVLGYCARCGLATDHVDG